MNPISTILHIYFLLFIPSVLSQKFAPFIPVPERDVTAPPPPPTIKILVCGDSITQGQEFDFTWRYRLWEWFRSNAAVDHLAPNLQYVDSYNGTLPKTKTHHHHQQSPPGLEGARGHDDDGDDDDLLQKQRTWGSYHPTTNPEFIDAHFALYGRPAWQVVDLLPTQVETYQPDIVVLHLGFNDIAWFGLKPAELVERMGWLVFRARLARRDVALLVADVSSRLLLEARQDLEGITIEYNNLLALKVEEWSTAESPVLLVKVREEYDCHVDSCPAGFDGLHPNALGDYQIARAYTKVLHTYFHYGSGPLVVPPTRIIPGMNGNDSSYPPVRMFMGLSLTSLLVVVILRRHKRRQRGFAADIYKRLPLAMQLKV